MNRPIPVLWIGFCRTWPISLCLDSFLWSPYGIEQTIIFSCCGFYLLLLFFPRLISAAAHWMSTILAHMAWPECEFRMQVWNVLHAARWKCRTQKSRQKSPSEHHRTTLSSYIFATKARIDNRKKNLLSSNMSSRCFHNVVNFGPLTAKIGSGVWGNPANFNGFRVLVRQSSSERQPNFPALNRGRHLCSAGRPSRWALTHISSCICIMCITIYCMHV